MEILEGQDQDAVLAQQVDQLEQSLEQPQLRGGIVAIGHRGLLVDAWKERCKLGARSTAERFEGGMTTAYERSEGPDQRGVGELAVCLLDRLPPEDQNVLAVGVGHAALELSHEPRLSDAGFATEQHHDRALLGSFT
jgi:hypothetical protein